MEIIWDTLGFAAKGFIVFAVIVVTVAVVLAMTRRRGRLGAMPHLEVRRLNERYQALADALRGATLGNKAARKLAKQRKAEQSAEKAAPAARPNVYVLDFAGDLFASHVKGLREEVSAIASVAGAGDEVVVRLESPGGAVPHYGLAAAQLARLKDKKIKLTVCIDRVAASGGYMMACVADSIVAAPFSIIGSIGVVAQVPNLHRLLKRFDVDYEEMTAGEFKRTVSVFGEITEKGRHKFQEQLEETHKLFKDFVRAQRPSLDVDQLSTGEYWLGTRAKELGLVDRIGTSDDYLIDRAQAANVLQLTFKPELSLRDRFGRTISEAVDRTVLTLLGRLSSLELR